jgi:LPXTG-motif cell wall-anchored protein
LISPEHLTPAIWSRSVRTSPRREAYTLSTAAYLTFSGVVSTCGDRPPTPGEKPLNRLICIALLLTGVALAVDTSIGGAQEPPAGDSGGIGAGVAAPVGVCPIGVALGGDVNSNCAQPTTTTTAPAAPTSPTNPATPTTPVAVGQTPADIAAAAAAPVQVCPIGIALGGEVNAQCATAPAPQVGTGAGQDVAVAAAAPIQACPIGVALGGDVDLACAPPPPPALAAGPGAPPGVGVGAAAPVVVCPVNVAIGGNVDASCVPAPGAPRPAPRPPAGPGAPPAVESGAPGSPPATPGASPRRPAAPRTTVSSPGRELPRTGSSTVPLTVAGVCLLAGGLGLMRTSRRLARAA